MLRQIDRISIGVMDSKFSLSIGRPLVDSGRRVKLVTGVAQSFDIFNLKAEMIDPGFQLRPFDFTLGFNRYNR